MATDKDEFKYFRNRVKSKIEEIHQKTKLLEEIRFDIDKDLDNLWSYVLWAGSCNILPKCEKHQKEKEFLRGEEPTCADCEYEHFHYSQEGLEKSL